TASSAETSEKKGDGRDHPVAHAIDGDTETRWCAASEKKGQWLEVSLPTAQAITAIQILWEEDAGYAASIMIPSGKKYKQIAKVTGNAKVSLKKKISQLRISVLKTPEKKWASIREVKLFGADGKQIKNEKIATTGTPEMVKFDDSKWRTLNVPHDWAVEGPFRYDLEANTGKLPWKGIGWYRKTFALPKDDAGKTIFLDFDGVMANAKIYCNGKYVGTWPYGYNSFRMDLTKFVKCGEDNSVAVRVDTTQWGSRWYPGAGIYRHVWLVKTSPVHVAHNGIFVTTPKITAEQGTVKIEVNIDNELAKDALVTASATIHLLDEAGSPGSPVAAGLSSLRLTAISAGKSTTMNMQMAVPKPKLWDLKTPNLYLVRTTVSVGDKQVDVVDTKFGFRTVEFTAKKGFLLNGRHVPIQGVCQHHDLGPLGAAMNTRALQRQIEILKEMGVNAIRTSHNPPAPELLELCDRMGVLVQVEAFDCWHKGKRAFDYARIFDKWAKRDVQAMVLRDRNHPSVFMWSTGNEIGDRSSVKGKRNSRMLTDAIHEVDPTRVVTNGCNGSGDDRNGFQKTIDVYGYNYHVGFYKAFHKFNPTMSFHASETSSCSSSRGEYFFPVKRTVMLQGTHNFHLSSYDMHVPKWGNTPDEQFRALDQTPACAGEFVWTGFDYLGEPTPFNRDVTNLLNFTDPKKRAVMAAELKKLGKMRMPSRSSYFGIIDLCGFPKDRFYLYQARWRNDLPMVHILPHWNWAERVGKVTPVHVYSSGDEVELFLNGKSLGRKKLGEFEYRFRWDDVKYAPGTLKAVAYKNGKKWSEAVMETTGKETKMGLSPDRAMIGAGSADLSFVTVKILDEKGRVVPRTHNLVNFTIDGPGEILAVGNGDPTSHESFQASHRKAFNGLCLVIVKAIGPGKITLTAQSEGLATATTTIIAK
ncbi:MAG: DUF4982 domain-containing protein, partial [Phycisphaerales bacterium]|nr:DUF4982 domain-containing protein [Phycisphaerales bacterium]MBT7171440.1 DUF4982 domain-containing protein [Phycisphaerales bacterium]